MGLTVGPVVGPTVGLTVGSVVGQVVQERGLPWIGVHFRGEPVLLVVARWTAVH